MSELRSAVESLRGETLASLPDARLEEDFAEIRRIVDQLELEALRRLAEIERRGLFEQGWAPLGRGLAGERIQDVMGCRARPGAHGTSPRRDAGHPRRRRSGRCLDVFARRVWSPRATPIPPRSRTPNATRRGRADPLGRRSRARRDLLATRRRARTRDRWRRSAPLTAPPARVGDDARHGARRRHARPRDRRDGPDRAASGRRRRDTRSREGRRRRSHTRAASSRRARRGLSSVARSTRPAHGRRRAPHIDGHRLRRTRSPAPMVSARPITWCSIPVGTARRLACDASVMRVVLSERSEPLDVGRRSKVVPPSMRRAVIVRDRRCRFPGCDRPHTWCDAHHIVHWADGGSTALSNLILLCRQHHRAIHAGRAPPGPWTTACRCSDDPTALASTESPPSLRR